MLSKEEPTHFRLFVRNGMLYPLVNPNNDYCCEPIFDGGTRIVFDASIFTEFIEETKFWDLIHETVAQIITFDTDDDYILTAKPDKAHGTFFFTLRRIE